MAADLITLDEAARRAGYAGGHSGNLRKAAAADKLKTRKLGWQRFTTQQWLDEYLATLKHTNAQGRGQPRASREQP